MDAVPMASNRVQQTRLLNSNAYAPASALTADARGNVMHTVL